MRLVLSVKDHELYSQKILKDLPKEQRSFRHYLALFSILQTLLVMNVGNGNCSDANPYILNTSG